MPAISKIRLTNVVYEGGDKRYNDEIFHFDGHNGAIVLENGGGKTVLIHTVLQAVIPHTNLGNRKIKETLQLEHAPAHIGIEWIKNDSPRRYVTTCVSLFLTKDGIDSFRYVNEYDENSPDRLEEMPFVRDNGKRPAERGEIMDYYQSMKSKSMYAKNFTTISEFRSFIEEHYHIIANEWESIVHINGDEGGIEKFFENCRNTNDLYDRLLIPTVENAIERYEAGMFADMFEKQRDGFHMYKKLRKSMEENRRIEAELEKYVGVFQRYTEQEDAYTENKQHAKGLWTLLNHQKNEAEQEQEANLVKINELEQDQENYHWKKSSFHIFLEKQKQTELEEAYTEQSTLHEEAKERLSSAESEYYSLLYADFKKQLKTYEGKLKQFEAELARKEKHEDLADLEAQMEETNRALKGYFVGEQEQLHKMIEEIQFELTPLLENREEIIKQEKQLEKEMHQLELERNKLETQVDLYTENANKLKQEILANPELQDVAEEKVKWEKRLQELDELIIQLGQRQKEIAKRLDVLDEEKDVTLNEKQDIIRELDRLEEKENQLQEAHDVLVEKLGTMKMKWAGITDLYMREHTVREELGELNQKLIREQDTLLQQERIARRLLDDYEEEDMFFGDVFLTRQLATWKNQLDYVISGVEFYQNLDKTQRRKYENYRLWPMTLITTKQSKQVLLDRLRAVRDQLHIPVKVLTLEEVQMLNHEQNDHWVEPAFWENNLDPDQFRQWKTELKEQAILATEKRQANDEALTQLTLVREQFEEFFHTYSKDMRDDLKENMKHAKEKLRLVQHELKDSEEESKALKDEEQTVRNNVETHQSEWNGLQGRLSKALEFLKLKKQIDENITELARVKENKQGRSKEIATVKRQIKRYDDEIDILNEEKGKADTGLKLIVGNADYQAVKDMTPVFTGEEKEVILARRQSLELELYNIETSYREIKAEINHAKENMKRITDEMKQLKEEQENRIDEELVFPPNGAALMEALQKRIKTEEEQVGKTRKMMYDAKSMLDTHKGKVKTEEQLFNRQFPNREIYLFEDTKAEIEKQLENERKKLMEREQFLMQEKKRLDKEEENIKEAINELDRFQEAHHFNSTQIKGKLLSESEISSFTYERMQQVQAVTKQLRSTKQLVDEAILDVQRAKQSFRRFCQQTIEDRKLQRMAIDGIEQKETYADIIQFQNNMVERLQQADQYAQDYISKNDKDLQAFIDRIHHHLRTVVEQLHIIPKKTRVKTAGVWKDIYKFTIPEWTDEEGKERIRDHIDWILVQLESDRFVNADGMEDRTKVRGEIEKWLQTKSLLQVVINKAEMKVSCRKVTNDNKVTSRFHSWKESNKWSGGEKWSKNMTLFLGILNFVAEKKQHLEGANTKRNRTVILDNPFGKASSDHVLSPVFFIAEQLGFQIIALTAHAEGKFLQDYFPVLYSCKLRPSADPVKKIMTKEKTLHHAYFQDHDPVSLERLGDAEQMELF